MCAHYPQLQFFRDHSLDALAASDNRFASVRMHDRPTTAPISARISRSASAGPIWAAKSGPISRAARSCRPDDVPRRFLLAIHRRLTLIAHASVQQASPNGQRQMIAFDTANMAERYNKRLAIVVPYRDRAEHLRQFVPHLATYFHSDKLDRHIPISPHIVEQSGNAPFNRGRVLNCGYALAHDSADYICFHDVDYLPLWADYSWSARPARLERHGKA